MPKRTPRGYRFRLMLGLPVMVLCFTLAAGFLSIGILRSALHDLKLPADSLSDLSSVVQNMQITVLLIALAATSLTVAIAAYIVRPIEMIIRDITELAEQRDVSLTGGDTSNEIEALTRLYRQAVTPLKGMLSSSDLLMQMSEGVVGLNRAGQIQMINAPVEALFGIERRMYIGKHYSEIFPSSTNFEVHELIQETIRTSAQTTRDIIVNAPLGRSVYVRVTASPATGGRNEPLGLVLLFKSFDEFNNVRDNLRKLDVLAALGTSVAGMAHEIKTPLGYIRSLAELLSEDMTGDTRQQEYLRTIMESVDRLNTMVGNILSLSKLPADMTSLQDPVTLAREAIAYTRGALQPNKLLLVEDYGENVSSIRGDRERLLEAFINLFKNACEASPAGGTVTVRVRPVRIGGPPSSNGSAVMVEFHNAGAPITPEQYDRLFLPFFTTKKEGTGLGLSITKQIIDSHDGAIRVESDAVTGTLFRVLLPAAESTLAAAAV